MLIVVCIAGAGCKLQHPTLDQPLCPGCRMIVEIDIFSGRPNPRWELSPEQTLEFQQKISALHRQTPSSPAFDGLGYRGLIVRDPGNPGSFFKIGFGRILHVKDGTKSYYSDEGRSLEKWLIRTGKGKVNDSLTAAIDLY